MGKKNLSLDELIALNKELFESEESLKTEISSLKQQKTEIEAQLRLSEKSLRQVGKRISSVKEKIAQQMIKDMSAEEIYRMLNPACQAGSDSEGALSETNDPTDLYQDVPVEIPVSALGEAEIPGMEGVPYEI